MSFPETMAGGRCHVSPECMNPTHSNVASEPHCERGCDMNFQPSSQCYPKRGEKGVNRAEISNTL